VIAAALRRWLRGLRERSRAEEALRESEERYRVFLEASADLAFLKDDAFRHVMVNRMYAAFFGRSVGEVLGKTDYDLMPAPVAEVCRRSDAEALAQGTVVEGEEQVGETTLQTRKFPVPLRGGGVGVGGFIRDVTAQRRAEAALAQERFLLRALMDHVPDSVYFKDRDSRIIRISSAQARRFGVRDAAEAVGRTDFDFFTEEHARQAYDDEQAILGTGQPVTKEERETWAGRPDTWVSTTKVPLRDEAGRVVGTFGISRDITERKQAEEERERLIQGLQEALAKVKTLSGLLPICASCKKIRDDSGYWSQLDRYVSAHSEAVFSHDICPECMRKLYPDLLEDGGGA
jgi:PAS domain S-box-containing protein